MVVGLTAMEAVGAAGGGGGGGAFFFPQAPITITEPRMTARANHFMRCCFTFISSCDPKMIAFRSDEVSSFKKGFLLPTPIRLRVATVESQLLHFGAVSQHHPDFETSRAVGLKHYMPSVGRPRRKIIPPA